MWLVAVAWMYVVGMMALAEAVGTSEHNGSVLGALVTLLLYGVIPLSIVLYILGTPGRKRRLRAAEQAASAGTDPDEGRHAPGAAETGRIPSVGEEP